MALEFDGFEAWQAIAENPETFAGVRAEASKTARAALTKCVKAKTAGIADLRSIRKALGKKLFALLIDGMKDAELKTLVTRLDRHHPDLKSSDAQWRRQHFLQLVRGDVDPSAKPAKPAARGKVVPKPKDDVVNHDWFVSAGAVRKRERKPD
jgi:hypothetical protein